MRAVLRLFCSGYSIHLWLSLFNKVIPGRVSRQYIKVACLLHSHGFVSGTIPFPYSFGSRVTTIPFDAILYRSVSLLRQVHHILTITFAGLGTHPVGRGIFADLRPDFSSTGSLTIHPVHATNAQQVPNSIGRE